MRLFETNKWGFKASPHLVMRLRRLTRGANAPYDRKKLRYTNSTSGLRRRRKPSERTGARRCRKKRNPKDGSGKENTKGKTMHAAMEKTKWSIGRAKGETTHPGRKKAQEEHDKKYPNAEGGTEARSALQSLKNGGSIARRA